MRERLTVLLAAGVDAPQRKEEISTQVMQAGEQKIKPGCHRDRFRQLEQIQGLEILGAQAESRGKNNPKFAALDVVLSNFLARPSERLVDEHSR